MAYELILIPLAVGMVTATALLVRMCAKARTSSKAAGAVFLIVMMLAMLLGALVYYRAPGTGGLVEGLWVSSVAMSLAVVPIFLMFLREARRQIASPGTYVPAPFAPTIGFSLLVVAFIVASEFLMGTVFELASGTSWSVLASGVDGPLNLVANVVQSPWFIFTMAAEMVLTILLLRRELPKSIVFVLAAQTAIMCFTPTVFGGPTWPTFAVLAGAVAMIVLFVFGMEFIYRNKEIPRPTANYLVRLFALYAVMMAGMFVWIAYGDTLLFALTLLAEMVLYFDTVLRPERFATNDRLAWQLSSHWAFGLLASIFVAEIFMGALLDQVIFPPGWFDSLGMLALSGSAGTVAYVAFYNGFIFLAAVTGSTWFLVMMGTEMGALVVYKLRETRSRETQIRLYLMMGSYAAFVVFFPSLYYSLVFPSAPDQSTVPLLGWSMGLGTETLAPIVFGVVAATYVIMAVLSMAFGRRWVCSTFCSASLMYQGTAIDSMKSFNRSSTVGHKYLGSRFSGIYSVTLGVTMAVMVATAVLSYLDGIGTLNVTILGLDPSVFFFSFSFAVLWYVMFVMIPYVGNYNCVTMGWCYTGTIAAAFQKIGAFKLKVRDKKVCQECTTVDCAKSCPVGLVDMPGHFRTKGEFTSTKCCGVGDCIEACPYGNMYIHDIRHVIGRWFGVDLSRRKKSANELPMVGDRRFSTRPAGPMGVPTARSPTRVSPADSRR